MKISELRKELAKAMKEHGDIEVTCTHSTLPEGYNGLADAFETTVENLHFIKKGFNGYGDKEEKAIALDRIRLYL